MPQKLFLDTNVYIIGTTLPESPEAVILDWIGFFELTNADIEVVISDALIDQILRVGCRVKDKDYSGELIARLWRNVSVHHVSLKERDVQELYGAKWLPREDVTVYLTAQIGKADCFISANHKLIRVLVAETRAFECLTPDEFVAKYLAG